MEPLARPDALLVGRAIEPAATKAFRISIDRNGEGNLAQTTADSRGEKFAP
jgi:hypothetical protein